MEAKRDALESIVKKQPLAACVADVFLPGYRASRVDPMKVLRQE
jgi:hypothetical protein